MNKSEKWQPSWWTQEVHGSAWTRVTDAMQRDWTQSKHDFGLGGHELNQSVADTAKQLAGSESIPPLAQANAPKVIGSWDEAELPYCYGHAARLQFLGAHSSWTPELEAQLKEEWDGAPVHAAIDWNSVKHLVKRGYGYDEDKKTWPTGNRR
jgi:hypothetical protein